MRARAEVRALTDYNPAAQTNGSLIIENGAIGHAGFIADFKIPRRPNHGFGIDMAATSEFGAEEAEDKCPPGVEWFRAGTKKQERDKIPQGAAQPVAQGKTWASESVWSGRVQVTWQGQEQRPRRASWFWKSPRSCCELPGEFQTAR